MKFFFVVCLFCISSFSCLCLRVFPGNKGRVRIYDYAEKGNSTTVTVIVQL